MAFLKEMSMLTNASPSRLQMLMYGSPVQAVSPNQIPDSPTKFVNKSVREYEKNFLDGIATMLKGENQSQINQVLMDQIKETWNDQHDQENMCRDSFGLNCAVNGQPRQLIFKEMKHGVEINLYKGTYKVVLEKTSFSQLFGHRESIELDTSKLDTSKTEEFDSDDSYDSVAEKFQRLKIEQQQWQQQPQKQLSPSSPPTIDQMISLAKGSVPYSEWRSPLPSRPLDSPAGPTKNYSLNGFGNRVPIADKKSQ
jgi:hypothetical protein